MEKEIEKEIERIRYHVKRDTFKEVLDLETGVKQKITDYLVELESSHNID